MKPMSTAIMNTSIDTDLTLHQSKRPGRVAAEVAIRTILSYIGDEPDREGLIETPARVVRALGEHFSGYRVNPLRYLETTFGETEAYDEMVLLRGIPFVSHCEHHMAPITGQAWVAYVPDGRVVGISKLARVVEAYARRLQIQEKLTAQIASTVDEGLRPKGVAVVIKASHACMTARGVAKPGTDLVTRHMIGCFRDDAQLRQEMLRHVE